MKLDSVSKNLLKKIADLHELPNGAVSFRKNGKSEVVKSGKHIKIEKKPDLSGINIFVSSNCKGEACHIPVVVTEELDDVVYNDFYIEDNAEVVIVAGCGIHSDSESSHNGIHTLHVGKGAVVTYVENHLATGKGVKQELNPVTVIKMQEGSRVVMKTNQLGGVTFSNRKTKAFVADGAVLEVNEKLLTSKYELAKTDFVVYLKGENSKCEIVSRSVAKDASEQMFKSNLIGTNKCYGRVECDAIVLDESIVSSQPKVTAKHCLAELTHEATIGRIANDQLVKLMTLGLTEEQATQKIIEGFLK